MWDWDKLLGQTVERFERQLTLHLLHGEIKYSS